MENQPSILQSHNESAMLKSASTIEQNMKRDRILVLIAGVLIHLVLGTFYMWGTISLYVASYLRSFDASVNIEMLSSVFPFASLGINVGLLFGLQVAERIGYRIVVGAGVIVLSISVFCTSFITSFYAFVLVYGVLVGICSGVIYIIPVVCGWKYFPNRKGLVTGFTIGAFGFGSFIYNFVALAIVNPNNENATADGGYSPPDMYNQVPTMFRVLGGCFLVMGLTGTVLLRTPKVSKILNVSAASQSEQEPLLPSASQPGCQSVKEGVLSWTFLNLLILTIFGSFFGLFLAVNYKVYGLTKINDDDFITLVGSLGSVANGITRGVWANLFDRFGFKKVYFVLISIQMIMVGTLGLISYSKPLYLIWYMLIMACEGGHFSLMPAVCAKVFGLKFGPKIYGYLFWGFAVPNFMGFFINKFALSALGWDAAFYMSLGFSGIAFLMNLIFKERFRPKKQVE